MGGKSSSSRRSPSFDSSSYDNQGYLQSSYTQHHPPYDPRSHLSSPMPYDYAPQPRPRLDRKFSRIADNYTSLDQVTAALAQAGLESSNLIVGIDFTKSNEWTGSKSFNRKSLHHIGNSLNPYEQAISIIGKTLSAFDEDNLIPCFGFGDASTHDQDVLSFYSDGRFCEGFEEVLSRYRELVPQLRLSGPTSFAPIIEMATTIVEESRGQYHVLLIIADGQVTRSVDTPHGQLSRQEQRTIDAIVKASDYPLSIVVVGVGDGPWDVMQEFDDNIPARAFDNFQFVNFTEIMSKNVSPSRKEAEFALSALMEIPSQYQATLELNILGHQTGNAPGRVALPPPVYGRVPSTSRFRPYQSSSFQRHVPYDPTDDATTPRATFSSPIQRHVPYDPSDDIATPRATFSSPIQRQVPYDPSDDIATPRATSSSSIHYDSKVCPICFTNSKDMAFGCGHQTCCDCGIDLDICPICRSSITTKIKLYS